MHDTAFEIADLFFKLHWRPGMNDILEIGSCDIGGYWSPGTIRSLAPSSVRYRGIDIEAGPNVDEVIETSETLPFPEASFDVVLASSVFEHDVAFWLTFSEMCRVLRPGGLIYINAPSNGTYHRFPTDNWRFYPDAGMALERWARRSGRTLTLLESFIGDRKRDLWNDFCAVFAGSEEPLLPNAYISQHFPCKNVHRLGEAEIGNFVDKPEDLLLLDEARLLLQQEQQARPNTSPAPENLPSLLAELAEIRHSLHIWATTSAPAHNDAKRIPSRRQKRAKLTDK